MNMYQGSSLVLAGFCGLLLAQVSRGDLLVFLPFNETGSAVTNVGTAGGAWNMHDATGVSADLHGTGVIGGSFDNTASSGMGSAGTGGRVLSVGDLDALDSLTSFTISGWLSDASTANGGGARIVNKRIGNTGYDLAFGNPGRLELTLNGQAALLSSNGAYSGATNQWTFFAVTFDGTLAANNVNFYVGTVAGSVTLVNTLTTVQTITSNTTSIVGIGGSVAGNNRPFDGSLDQIRIHGSQADGSGALSLAELESLRSADVVPEPGAALLFGLGALAVFRALKSNP